MSEKWYGFGHAAPPPFTPDRRENFEEALKRIPVSEKYPSRQARRRFALNIARAMTREGLKTAKT